MSKITIQNLRLRKPEHAWQVRVDRASILGNPFYMHDESQRNRVCEQYEEYFYGKMQHTDTDFYKEVMRLHQILQKFGKLELYCWCTPKRCHAETIKNYIENL